MKTNTEAYSEWLEKKTNPRYFNTLLQRIKQIWRFFVKSLFL